MNNLASIVFLQWKNSRASIPFHVGLFKVFYIPLLNFLLMDKHSHKKNCWTWSLSVLHCNIFFVAVCLLTLVSLISSIWLWALPLRPDFEAYLLCKCLQFAQLIDTRVTNDCKLPRIFRLTNKKKLIGKMYKRYLEGVIF